MAWLSGQQLQDGKYTIEKKLGHGGFGITYLAKDKKGNSVVIKTLLKEPDADSDDFNRCQQDFVNEALRLAKCSHPHIVKVHECINEGGLLGIVMEYIDGEELGNLGSLPESKALTYIYQIGEALSIVHQNGLLHRDVKPENILVRNNKSEAVLIDFGIARDFTPNSTQTHTAYQTPFYAPPEQYNERAKRGAFTDVYALAATLYKVLTGKEPESAISRMMGEPLAPPNKLNPNISDRVNKAILKGLELQSENRPQSVQDWLELLKVSEGMNLNLQELFSHLTKKVEKVIHLAHRESRRLGYKYIGLEQILLGLIAEDTSGAGKLLKSMGVNLTNARLDVEAFIGRGQDINIEMLFTPQAEQILQMSWEEALKLEDNRINTQHLLLALIQDDNNRATIVLNNLGVELPQLRRKIIANLKVSNIIKKMHDT
jgi:serine/threonine protein kinase